MLFQSFIARCRAAGRALSLALPLGMVLGLASSPTLAQMQLKIAVLDMSAALFNSERAKTEDDKVRLETSEDENKVRALAEQATALQEKLQKDGSIMSEDQRRRAAEEIEELGVQYNFLVQKLQRMMQERRQNFQQAYTPNLIQAITAVIEEEKFDIVFRAEAVLHYNNVNDITAQVTAKLNQQQ
jgi:outer membrane protein